MSFFFTSTADPRYCTMTPFVLMLSHMADQIDQAFLNLKYSLDIALTCLE